MEHLAYFLYKD